MKINKFVSVLAFLLVLIFPGCHTIKPPAGAGNEVENELPKQDSIAVEEPEAPVITEGIEVEEAVPAKPERPANVPTASREFRAAWVATVANINWPSKPGLSSREQQQEAIALLDFLKQNNFNAVIFQVRPQADALYESSLEPWSYFLTGQQGKAPEPFYDPLHFWIEAAHDRGLELHAWLNPYRAQHLSGGEIGDESIIKTNPELVVQLKDGQYWMDPSKEGTQEHSTAVVMDIVKRYDVDGIHFDDYFYPYDSYNDGEDFPDDKSWAVYQESGGELSRGDWRRGSVNTFIQDLYKKIKDEKPHVKFGLSPFGIWRPGYPESIAGYDQYNKLFADAKLWLNEGWIDYFTPQLYWKTNQVPQSFPVLLGWWSSENDQKRHLWPGINAALGEDEVINQIMITRGMMPKSPGVVHWSIAPLVKSDSLATAIVEGPYKKEALVPASPWLDDEIPKAPVVVPVVQEEMLEITWVPGGDEKVFKYVIYYKYGTSWNYKILDHNEDSLLFKRFIGKAPLTGIAVTAVDRTGNESEFEEIVIKE